MGDTSYGRQIGVPTTDTSIPTGGTVGQALVKQSSTDGDADWETLATGAFETLNTVASVSGTYEIDLALGTAHDLKMTGDTAFSFAALVGAVSGTQLYGCTVILRQDDTGGWVPSFAANVKWESNTQPTWPTAANATIVLAFFTFNAGATWWAKEVGRSFGGTAATPVEVQQVNATASAATSCPVTIAPATAGNLLVCVHNALTGAGNVSTPAGFTQAVEAGVGTNETIQISYKVAAGGETTVTPTTSASVNQEATVFELSGMAASSPLDVTTFNSTLSNVTTLSSGSTAATAQAVEWVVAAFGTGTGAAGGYSSFSNDFVEQADGARMGVATKVTATAAAQETTAVWTNARSVVGVIAAFKASVS